MLSHRSTTLYVLLISFLLLLGPHEVNAASSMFASAKSLKSKVGSSNEQTINNNKKVNNAKNQPPQPEIHHVVERHEQKIHKYNKGLSRLGGRIGKGIAFAALSMSLANVVGNILQYKSASSNQLGGYGDEIDFLICALAVYFASLVLMIFLI